MLVCSRRLRGWIVAAVAMAALVAGTLGFAPAPTGLGAAKAHALPPRARCGEEEFQSYLYWLQSAHYWDQEAAYWWDRMDDAPVDELNDIVDSYNEAVTYRDAAEADADALNRACHGFVSNG
jgi:hypothetical protein